MNQEFKSVETGYIKTLPISHAVFQGYLTQGYESVTALGNQDFLYLASQFTRHQEQEVGLSYTKLFSPLTIFFRFHTAFDFLEYYWKHDTVIDNRQENAQLSNKDQIDCYTV